MFCKFCGKEFDDSTTACPYCGAAVEAPASTPITPNYTAQPSYSQQAAPVDNGGFWWGLLGCCIPIVGLVLFLVWKDTKPKTAKAAGIGALVWVGLVIAYYILIIVLGSAFAFML